MNTGSFVTAEHAGLLKEISVTEYLSWEGVGINPKSCIAIFENGVLFYETISTNAEQVYYHARFCGAGLDVASGTGWSSSACMV